jgi:hypothetical protein
MDGCPYNYIWMAPFPVIGLSNCTPGVEGIFVKFNYLIRKSLYGVILLGLALAPVGIFHAQAAATGNCPTKMVSITLASQQISFCAPTSRP